MQLVFEECDVDGVNLAPSARKIFNGTGGVIGRGAGCDWVIPDPSRLLSSHHGLVAYREGRYFLTDISSNGIGVAGSTERLCKGQARLISEGDVYQLGPLAIRARLVVPVPPRGEQWDVAGGTIPDDAFLALDPIHSLDLEHQHQTRSQDLEALDESVDAAGPWADQSTANRDHLAIPRRAEAVQETPQIHSVTMPPPASEAFWAQFAAALGIGLDTLDRSGREALAIKAARLLRMGVEGLQQSLRTCEELKGELNLSPVDTVLKSRNPLKDCVDADAALAMQLGAGDLGRLPAEQAINQAHRDLQTHQVALLAACRSAIRNTHSAFAPGHLLMCFEYQDKRPRFSSDGGHWRAYQRHYQRLIETDQGSDRLPGGDFAKVYEEQVRLISTLHVGFPG